MSNNILKVKYYGNGLFKGSEGASIFQSSNQQSTLQFKFDEDLGDASVVANILIPYPEGSQLYGQHQTQSLFMKKQVDSEGGYIYSGAILRGYLATNGKAYVNAQVYASDGYIDSTNAGQGIVVNGIAYIIDYTTETIDGVSHDLLVLEDANTGRIFTQQQEGIIVLEHNLICLIKQFVASRDGDNLFNGTLRLTSGVEVKNYQQVEFKITASAPYYAPYPLTIEESYILRQQIAQAQSDILDLQNDKQDKDDENIHPGADNDHTVVGNINDLLTRMGYAEGDIVTLQGEMVDAQADIGELQRLVSTGIDIVGVMQVNNDLPSDSDVTDFVITETGEAPKPAQAVIVEVEKTDDPDEVYLYTYNGEEWNHFAIQFLNKAQNGNEGVVEGDYALADLSTPNKFMVSIVNGKIVNLYRVNASGKSVDFITMADKVIEKVLDDSEGAVNRAIKDADGHTITSTYMTKEDGASKTFVQHYASPKALYDIYYPDYSSNGFRKVNTNDNSYNKTVTSSQIGYTTLANQMQCAFGLDVLLGDQNGVRNKIQISSTNTETIKLRITTGYSNLSTNYEVLSQVESPHIQLTAGSIEQVTIDSIFSDLATPNPTQVNARVLRQTIEIWREVGTSADFTLICNEAYPSTMELNKIGFVRYSLELEPSELTTGTDSTPTIDGDGDLLVQSTGTIKYENDEVAPLDYNIKIPMDNGLNDPTSVLPARAGQVAGALKEKADITDIAPAYDSTSTYAVGDIVSYDGDIYKCNTAISVAEAWDSAHWARKSVQELIEENVPDLSNYVNLDGEQTITGQKTFGASIKFSSSGTKALYYGNTNFLEYSLNNGMKIGETSMAIGVRNTLYPNTTNRYSLGRSSNKWQNLYLAGKLTDGTHSISVANIQPKVVVDTTSTSPITLTNGKSFRLGTISALTINNPSSYELDFECEVIFTADTGISMTYSAVAPTWSGDDVSGGIFTPQANKTYNILFFNNATAVATPSIQAIVRGV